MRIFNVAAVALALAPIAAAQTDWPMIGHDAGGTRFSPLKQVFALRQDCSKQGSNHDK